MHDHHRRRRFARLLLAVAGLLYLVGMAADPLLHAGTGARAAVEVVAAGHDGLSEGSDGAAHADWQCLYCTVAGAFVLPAGSPGLSARVVRAGADLLPSGPARTPPVHTLARPRAPPA